MRVFLFTVLLCLQLALAAAANVPLMPVRDIQPGMQGIGKTVISGDTIEEFNVEILGVSGTQATGYNIFARLYGDLIDKTGGVAQGMSGSPVYVDGRLGVDDEPAHQHRKGGKEIDLPPLGQRGAERVWMDKKQVAHMAYAPLGQGSRGMLAIFISSLLNRHFSLRLCQFHPAAAFTTSAKTPPAPAFPACR